MRYAVRHERAARVRDRGLGAGACGIWAQSYALCGAPQRTGGVLRPSLGQVRVHPGCRGRPPAVGSHIASQRTARRSHGARPVRTQGCGGRGDAALSKKSSNSSTICISALTMTRVTTTIDKRRQRQRQRDNDANDDSSNQSKCDNEDNDENDSDDDNKHNDDDNDNDDDDT